MDATTMQGATVTRAGMILHKPHPAGFDCPVMLNLDGRTADELPEPIRIGGKLVYALPGGGIWRAE